MAGLLDQRRVDRLLAIADRRVNAKVEGLRRVVFAKGAVPPGHVDLDSSEKVATFDNFLKRQAERERRGTIPGNVNQTMQAHPAVQGMLAEQAPATPEVL
jgi:hypothetical protein